MKLPPLLACLLLCCLSPALTARENPPNRGGNGPGDEPRGERGPRRGPEQFLRRLPVVQALDSDGDLIISEEELKDAPAKLKTLDKNKDQILEGDEILPPPPEGREPQGGEGRGPGIGGGPGAEGFLMRLPLMSALDQNRDGKISPEEQEGAPGALAKLDTNQDGRIEMRELAPPRPPRGGRGPGRRGPGGRGPGFGPQPENVDRQSPDEIEIKDGAATIPDRAAFEALSYQGEDVMIDTHLAGNQFVKFQIEGADGDNPELYFINTKTHRAHMRFMSAVGIPRARPGEGAQMRGVLVYRPRLKGLSGDRGLYTFEFNPNDRYPFETIRRAYELLVGKSAELRGRLGYYPMPAALIRYREEKDLYDDAPFRVYLDEDLFGDIDYLPLNHGESFGRLRIMELDEYPRPREIVVYRSLPNEMPRTAGIITEVRQTPLSHVNLRAIQDKVPNAFIAGASQMKEVSSLAGKYVYYKVDREGFTLREAKDDEVEGHFAKLRPVKPQKPSRHLEETRIRALEDIGFEDWKSVGVKAANLAAMSSFELSEGVIPQGFAVPFHFYHTFMSHNGFYEKVAELLSEHERLGDSEALRKALGDFRTLIREGDFPDDLRESLAKIHASFPEGTSLRCRSSTNNEDLPGFSGAGLYDSCTHRVDEGHLANSVKQVFASLWNFRAVQEREFYRIDHMLTSMGVLIHPNYDEEEANGVAVTTDILYRTEGTYYLNTQVGEDLVTNPEEDSVPEELLLDWFDAGKTKVMRRSNHVKDGLILSPEHLDQLREALGIIHNRFAKLYGYSYDARDFAMELEFKVTREGKLSIKQARPWVFSE